MTSPDWLADAVFYQIFPERFANGDPSLDPPGVERWEAIPTQENFFGGDLVGITQHLDHIQSVGANAIYLTPIFEADTNHRYDAKDYFTIDHRLGDLNAFRGFVDAAHARGIRVVLDAVFNHCGDGHWAFQDVVENEAASTYVNWFSVENFPVSPHPVPNYRTCSGCYYLPKWNAYNPEVRDHHYRVARYWVEQGIDGWRLDVPYFINHNFWRGFRDVVKSASEELYLVAEEWRDLVLGFTADLTVDAEGFATGMNALTERIPLESRQAMLNILGSHDTERVLTRHGGDAEAAELAYALLFSAEGAPMIYYGDEVGLEGENDPGCRGTMPWDERLWSQGLLSAVRSLSGIRQATPALRRGAQRVGSSGPDTVVIHRELADGRAAVVMVNRGEHEQSVSLSGFTTPQDCWEIRFGGIELRRDGTLSVPARSTVILATAGGEQG